MAVLSIRPKAPETPVPRRNKPVRRRDVVGILLAVPAMALFLAFAIYPMLRVFYLSLFDYSLTAPPEFVGFDNFAYLATDPQFGAALWQTVVYAVGTYVPAIVLALVLAHALNTRARGSGLLRLLYFLPVAISWVAVSVIWRVVLNPDGLLNQALGLHLNWLTSSGSAMWGLVLMGVWKETGFFLILFLAGLQSIPGELYEASRLDGAGAFARFRYITWPMLLPVTAVCSVMAVIRGFQAFSPQLVLTNGGFGTQVVNLFVYKTAFENARMGRASAVAVLMFLLLFGLTLLQLKVFARRDR
ncbi:carbohydrate ABC transporter permease [Amycolatopsis sp. NPDC059021]|uniref:carbohydrate ABC transporter permease n=1 Tax=Amycolatopsis sp. NPDC059021 TaxID=3346704 RepID=UPI0036709F7E